FFCHRPWPISSLPDSRDFDPERAAFLAAVTRILCASFNDRIERGLPRDAPAYITDFDALSARPKILEHIPPLDRTLRIEAQEGDTGLGLMGVTLFSERLFFPHKFCTLTFFF
ncbi:hypothetical protein B0H13DRAFT_1630704, partial [Mycena leptocephala]